jgi:hypothetical protein
MGAAELAFYNSLWKQAASEGISVFVASGDAGAAGCSSGSDVLGSGAAVNGLCSPPYSTCTGGTEFNEGSDPSEYWSSTNSSSYGSALGYIPEEVWNESALNGGSFMWASGGGVSQVYEQPGFQLGVAGISAAGGMRAVPDVALSAADHDGYFVVENGSYWIVSGTSVAAPSFAGLMALILSSRGGEGQGNANEQLYSLAVDAQSPFHSTLSGNNSVPGVRGFTASGTAFNLATGLGSVDGAHLVSAWGLGSSPPTLTLTPNSSRLRIARGGSARIELTVATGGSFAGAISLLCRGLPAGVTAAWSVNPTPPVSGASSNTIWLTLAAASRGAPGYYNVEIIAQGNGIASSAVLKLQVAESLGCALPRLRLPCVKPPPVKTSGW